MQERIRRLEKIWDGIFVPEPLLDPDFHFPDLKTYESLKGKLGFHNRRVETALRQSLTLFQRAEHAALSNALVGHPLTRQKIAFRNVNSSFKVWTVADLVSVSLKFKKN
ncbi:hypothetical protein HY994_00325 [Candidatus Micrarchaeota archaeon]|nr:hypothetical protein [Candidatus Micrarchaeota archaeon]